MLPHGKKTLFTPVAAQKPRVEKVGREAAAGKFAQMWRVMRQMLRCQRQN